MLGAFMDMAMEIPRNMHREEMQNDQQDWSSNEAQWSRSFNSAEAHTARAWSERMDNTKYQRTTQDLLASGLNPILAYGHGPGSTPGAAHASSSPAGGGGSSGGGSGHSFAAGMQSASQIAVNDATIDRIKAEADKIRAEEGEIKARTPTHEVNIDRMKQDITESVERIHHIREQVGATAASAGQARQQTVNLQEGVAQIRATVQQLKALTDLNKAQITESMMRSGLTAAQLEEIQQRIKPNLPQLEADLRQLEAQLRMLQMPGHRNDTAIQESFLGITSKVMRALNPLYGILSIGK